MVFHGPTGASRGRASASGRSASQRRGTAASLSNSRGRGRGGFRPGRGKTVFDSARVAKEKTEEDSEPQAERLGDEELSSQSESSDPDDEDGAEVPPVRSYAALMHSLASEAVSASKRRKLERIPGPKAVEARDHRMEQAEADIHEVDDVVEPEEGPEIAANSPLEDEDDLEDASDPFVTHFADPADNVLSRRLESLRRNLSNSQQISLPVIGKAIVSVPDEGSSNSATSWAIVSGPKELKLKQKLARVVAEQRSSFDALESHIAPFIFNYQDVMFCERSPSSAENLQRLICLHIINHIFKTRDRVIKNNARLAKDESSDVLELRDQGFTRPKVLMILPTRESCVRIVDMITALCQPEQQENRKRFEESYVTKGQRLPIDKPPDFAELFGGNDDDMFRLGLKFTRKTIKYFSQFYNSDIIFASPLGLRMALGGTDDMQGDYDFLSSIEMVVVDQAEALLMQNWEHVEYIFEHLNLQPKQAHGCDFSRVRNWYLDNNAKHFRQVIALTAFNTPELNTLFFNQSKNWAGKVRFTSDYQGAVPDLGLKIKQTFSRLQSPSLSADPDARFTYFTTVILPALTRRAKDTVGTIVFIPSYLDFIRVRNYFSTSPSTSSLSFGSISEYTTVRDEKRARSHFFTGRHSILLYTERAHHFNRFRIRGTRKVIMYGLPDNPAFYKEIVGGYLGRSVQEGKLEPGEGSVRVIFSQWDALKLERVVGTKRYRNMITEKGDTFDFL